MGQPHVSGSTENEYEMEPLPPLDIGGGPPGRLSENEPVEDCSESEPLGVKQMEGLLLGVSEVELTIRGGTVISEKEDKDEDEDEDDDEAEVEDEDVVVCVPAGGTEGAVMSACRSSSWNERKLAMLASSNEIDCLWNAQQQTIRQPSDGCPLSRVRVYGHHKCM
jgi:N-acetylmuramic acid 6-phosphate (MurNAc-6-P) etherase